MTPLAKDAKFGSGRLFYLARAEPVVITKCDRPVIVAITMEEYERLAGNANSSEKTDEAGDSG